jgi:hypothetical protein
MLAMEQALDQRLEAIQQELRDLRNSIQFRYVRDLEDERNLFRDLLDRLVDKVRERRVTRDVMDQLDECQSALDADCRKELPSQTQWGDPTASLASQVGYQRR